MNSKLIKKLASLGAAVLITAGCMSESLNFADVTTVNAASSGSCGTNLRWSVSGSTLTISGSGTTMNSYGSSSNTAPWRSYAGSIKTVVLPSTLKTVGNYAFYKMSALQFVSTSGGGYTSRPCLPDLETIGEYAFADCYAFKGNTENGNLSFGTGSVSSTGTLFVGDSSFQNCDKVRFIKAYYKKITVDRWGFYSMDSLQSFNCGDTQAELGYKAFLNDSKLTTVNYRASVYPINNTAFDNTPYKTNSLTSVDYDKRNMGTITKLQGRQLIVNFFVDRTTINLDEYEERVKTFASKGIQYDKNTEFVTTLPSKITDTTSYVGIFKKSDVTCKLNYSWQGVKGSRTNNSAVELNKLDYSLYDTSSVPLSSVQNVTTSGCLGSYINSSLITNRLDNVRNAMDNMQEQAKKYGATFSYVMNPETNFHITYDTFDWTTKESQWQGASLGYSEVVGYSGGTGQITATGSYGDGITFIDNTSTATNLFDAIYTASTKLKGDVAQTIDMNLNQTTRTSKYAEYLKKKYRVDGVIFLVHLNTASLTAAYPTYNDSSRVPSIYDEFAVICEDGNASNEMHVAHEISHLCGAVDIYEGRTVKLTDEARYYADVLLEKNELMYCKSTKVSPLTAFSIGWLDDLDKSTYNAFFSNCQR